MFRKLLALAVLTAVTCLFSGVETARADVAPPQQPPGASPNPGWSTPPTKVQMLAEEVVVVVEATPADPQAQFKLASMLVGHVEAVFRMRNQGTAEEAFDVWFPIAGPDHYGHILEVENFSAWVDGAVAQVARQSGPGPGDSLLPWATWPAKFPAGQEVTLRVKYDMHPTGYAPYGTFEYLLETGAGWYGPIGSGTITFRLPYPVNRYNVSLQPEGYFAPQPAYYQVQGREVSWHFTNLEPGAADNIRLTVLLPQVWEKIEQAQAGVAAQPASSDAQLKLAEAWREALVFKGGLLEIGDSQGIAQAAEAAYRRAIELDPDSSQAVTGYARLLMLWWGGFSETPPPDFLALLARALQLEPGAKDLQRFSNYLLAEGYQLPTPARFSGWAATYTPEVSQLPASAVTSSPPTSSPAALGPKFSPAPSAALPATSTMPASGAGPTRASPEAAAGRGSGGCPGALALAVPPLLLVGWQEWRLKRRFRHPGS